MCFLKRRHVSYSSEDVGVAGHSSGAGSDDVIFLTVTGGVGSSKKQTVHQMKASRNIAFQTGRNPPQRILC